VITYTDEERRLILKKSKELRTQGKTLEGFRLIERMEKGEPIQLWEFSNAPRPEKNVPLTVQPPPFMGRGSSTEAWRKFAGQVLDIESGTLQAFDRRQDIIQLLVDRGVIDQPDTGNFALYGEQTDAD
jgi:hypothetical protein